MINKKLSRRDWITSLTGGMGALGLAGMFSEEQARAAAIATSKAPAAPAPMKFPNFTPKAKAN
ncbi:MAG: hypothetical protein QOJ99_5101, partial [Bryobacterales bacterium]|nr:hypothetical protein [Bryobacterales bacterium]